MATLHRPSPPTPGSRPVRAIIQRVTESAVTVDGREVGAIGRGLMVLLGVARGDDAAKAEKLADKIVGYRIFPDAERRMNLSLKDVGGEMLVVSQFTLCADTRKGRRPGFDAAAPPDIANALYQHFVEHVRGQGVAVATGEFGAMMQVSLINDGPVTFTFET